MMDLSFIQSLIKAVDESSIDSVDIERGGTRVRISKTPAGPSAGAVVAATGVPMPAAPVASAPAAPAAAAPAAAEAPDSGSNLVEVTSPMVGTFYAAPAPEAPPYVKVGQSVGVGDTLCIIEAMKLMNELEAEVSGSIAEICVQNGEPVEYGQVLFRIDPA